MSAAAPPPRRSLAPGDLAAERARLRAANLAFAQRYAGAAAGRQPVHTVYGAAHLFHADVAAAHGEAALRALDEHAPDAAAFARALGLPADALAEEVHTRVRTRLRVEPVEDFRIDFEDGYGYRLDDVEDGHAVAAGREAARGLAAGSLPRGIGLRIRALAEDTRERAARTLDLFLTALLEHGGGRLPPGFVVTVPKLVIPEQASYAADLLAALEARLALEPGALALEMMVETPQALLDVRGASPLPAILEAARGRLRAAHLGVYDYTAALGIVAGHQGIRHPACDLARQLMQLAFAGTGLQLSDGSTAVAPPLDSRDAVHAAWRRHFDDVRHSLVQGFFQGWDLHAVQLPTRYAALQHFFLSGRAEATRRLAALLEREAAGEPAADPHAVPTLLAYFRRGVACGAFDAAELAAATGVSTSALTGA